MASTEEQQDFYLSPEFDAWLEELRLEIGEGRVYRKLMEIATEKRRQVLGESDD